MDGVFMKNTKRFIGFLVLVACLVYILTLFEDRNILGENVVRLHVVANSDTQEDQAVKLEVRDAVMAFLEENMAQIPDAHQAKQWLQAHLPEIEAVANQTLQVLGQQAEAVVTFLREAFPTKAYDSFSLPAGVYDALKITIGEGQGQNWWCVVFPSLCLEATAKETADVAAGAGFSEPLADTITGRSGYRVRFFFLELLGKLESLFY